MDIVRFIVNERDKLIFLPIPKCAGSSLCHWMLKSHGIQPEFEKTYARCYEEFSLNLPWHRDHHRDLLNRFFIFTIVRDPLSRLVSAFLQKFVVEDFRLPAAVVLVKCLNIEPEALTFRQFVHFIIKYYRKEGEAGQVANNEHWRHQYKFMEGVKFDYIGKLEAIDEVVETVRKATGVRIKLPVRNKTNYRVHHGCVADSTVLSLRKMQGFPYPVSYYDNELLSEVRRFWKKDFDRFGYNLL